MYRLENYVDIIVSDNASLDDTLSVLQKYKKENPQIFFYNTNDKNLGFENNLIKAMELSNSRYVYMCGDDDIYRKGLLKIIVDILLENKIDCLHVQNYDDKVVDDELYLSKDKLEILTNKESFLNIYAPYFISSLIVDRKFFLHSSFHNEVWPHTIRLINAPDEFIFAAYNDKCVFVNREEDAWHKDRLKVISYLFELARILQESQCQVLIKQTKKNLYHNFLRKELFDLFDEILEKMKENSHYFKETILLLEGELPIFKTLYICYKKRIFYILKYPKIYKDSKLRKYIFLIAFHLRITRKLINLPKKIFKFIKKKCVIILKKDTP